MTNYDNNYYRELERDCMTEFIGQSDNYKLAGLLPVYNRIQSRKDQNMDITISEYQAITGSMRPGKVKTDMFGREYVSFETCLDRVCNEYGYENSETLYAALERLAQYQNKQMAGRKVLVKRVNTGSITRIK